MINKALSNRKVDDLTFGYIIPVVVPTTGRQVDPAEPDSGLGRDY